MEARIVPLRETSSRKYSKLLFDGADLDLVQITRRLLAVASDERNCGAFVQQLDCGHQPLHGDLQRPGNVEQKIGRKRLEFVTIGQNSSLSSAARI